MTIQTSDCCFDGENIWFTHISMNVLLGYNLKKKTIRSYIIPYREKYGNVLYKSIVLCADKLLLIPAFADRIVIFEKNEECFSFIDVSAYKKPFACASVVVNDSVYILACAEPVLLKMDICKKNLERLLDLSIYAPSWIFGSHMVRYKDDFLVIARIGSGNLFLYNICSNDCTTIKTDIHSEFKGEIGLACCEDNLYICTSFGDDYVYKIDMNLKKTVCRMRKRYNCFSFIWKTDVDSLILDYADNHEFDILDGNLGVVRIGNYGYDKLGNAENTQNIGIWKPIGVGLCVNFNNIDSSICIYDSSKMTLLEKHRIFLDVEKEKQLKTRLLRNEKYIYENEELSLKDFFLSI